jgi:2-hydroxy-6-oxonona-2,4-dienedioate hydrolase
MALQFTRTEVPLSPISARAGESIASELSPRQVTVRGESGEDVQAKIADVGVGRPVVFLHGLVGLNDHWEGVVNRVRHRVRCILIEFPLLKLQGPDCSVGGASLLTERLLEQEVCLKGSAYDKYVLVGNSFGGHVALRIALARPDMVGGLVLAGASGLIERTMVKEITVRPSREWMRRKISELFYDPAKHMREADLDRAHKEISERSGARAMLKLSRSARSDHLGSRIHQIQAPCLLIWGKEDIVTPPEAAHEFMSRLPDGRIVWYDQCGHAPMIEKPEEFAEAMLKFADELDAREAAQG